VLTCAPVRAGGQDEMDAFRAGSVALDGHSLHRAYAAHHDLPPPAAARQHDARGSAVGPSFCSTCLSLGVGGGSLEYDVQSREFGQGICVTS
jgi:hypothetical protein